MPRTVPIGAVVSVGALTIDNPQTESLAFPPAALTADGAKLQAQGATPEALHYDKAGWTLPAAFVYSTDDDARAAVNAVTAALQAQKRITFTMGSRVRVALLHEIDAPVLEWIGTGECSATWGGSRWPEFEGESGAVTLIMHDGADFDTVSGIPGDLITRTTLKAVTGVAIGLIAVGIEHDPAVGFAPIDSYSGVTDTAAHGDAWSATTTLDGTYKALGTAPAIDAQANRGYPFIVARTKQSATATFRADSVIAAVSRVGNPMPYSGTQMYGRLRVPAAELPSVGTGTAYYDETAGATNTTGSTYLATTYPAVTRYGQTFAHAGGLQTGVAFWIKGHPYDMTRMLATVTGPNGEYTGATVDVAAAFDGIVRFTWDGIAIPAGTVTARLQSEGGNEVGWQVRKAGAYAGGAAFTMGYPAMTETAIADDLYFTAYRRAEIVFDATTPIMATGSGTAQVDFAARIPGRSAIVVKRPTNMAAGTGIVYDELVYPYNGTSVSGTAIGAGYGDGQFGLAPGVDNAVVGVLGVGADATLTLDYTALYLGLM